MRWGIEPLVGPRSPSSPRRRGDRERVEWLRIAMQGRGRSRTPIRRFRDAVVDAVSRATVDTVIASHFVAINAVIGSAWATTGS